VPKDRRVQGAVDLPLAAVPAMAAMAAIMAAPVSALRDSRAEAVTILLPGMARPPGQTTVSSLKTCLRASVGRI